jgi:hypothetical protein
MSPPVNERVGRAQARVDAISPAMLVSEPGEAVSAPRPRTSGDARPREQEAPMVRAKARGFAE